jgi:hypothetical protein
VPLWVAGEQGIFNKYGVDSEQIFIRGAPTLVAGLASGDIHIGSTGEQSEACRVSTLLQPRDSSPPAQNNIATESRVLWNKGGRIKRLGRFDVVKRAQR